MYIVNKTNKGKVLKIEESKFDNYKDKYDVLQINKTASEQPEGELGEDELRELAKKAGIPSYWNKSLDKIKAELNI